MMSWFIKTFVEGGIRPGASAAQARAIRMGNLISLSAVGNTFLFALFFLYLRDFYLLKLCLLVNSVYLGIYLLGIMGFQKISRPLNLICGNLVVFYFSNFFRGHSELELLLFSLSVAPFMFFSWEERRGYFLSLLPVTLYLVGEFNEWSFFALHEHNYDLRIIRIISVIATIHQIIAGYYYFLKQSVKFEAESNENLFKLEIEHRKQLQVQKMSSLGEMAAGVSHEINNPLMVIIGKTYHLKRELKKSHPEGAPVFAHLEKIDAMVHRISKIIRALKNFSRNSDNDSSERVALTQILESTLDLCRERFSSCGISLIIKQENELHIIARPTEISQVLLNLLNNAFDAVQETKDAHVCISAQRKNDMVEILVEDNGYGISAEIAEKIMQPFFTTKEVGRGTGLGLSISKGLIESHGGSLSLLSDREKTTFQLLLPPA